MMVEATYDIRRGMCFSNLCAESLFLYYILVTVKAQLKHDRRKATRV